MDNFRKYIIPLKAWFEKKKKSTLDVNLNYENFGDIEHVLYSLYQLYWWAEACERTLHNILYMTNLFTVLFCSMFGAFSLERKQFK